MNYRHPSTAALDGASHPRQLLQLAVPRNSDPPAPVFMQPLLPPQPAQGIRSNVYNQLVASPSSMDFAQSPTHQVQSFAPHLQEMTAYGHSSHGSDDSDDGYALEFPSLEAFQRWRSELEDRETVEFVKADVRQSNSCPPRYKDTVRFVCVRSLKNVKIKYLKTLPKRERSGSSCKVDADGCGASISCRTYNNAAIVRVKYHSQHSHPTGPENIAFTSRGRKLAEQERKVQKQDRFSRTKPALNGSAFAERQQTVAPKNRGRKGSDAVRHEPPPMARLEPPTEPPKNLVASGESLQELIYPNGFVEGGSPTHALPVTTELGSGAEMSSYDTASAERTTFSNPASVASPYAGDNGHSVGYYPYHPQHNQIEQPQPIYVLSEEDIQHQQYRQPQYLPTPTTPSSQIHSLHSHPPQYRSSDVASIQGVHIQNRPMHDTSYLSPLSPVTPHPYSHHNSVSSSDSQLSATQCHQQEVFSFNQDRWNRLETLFQAVRLRARNNVLPEPVILALESLLGQLYAEGPQGHFDCQSNPVSKEPTIHDRQHVMRHTPIQPSPQIVHPTTNPHTPSTFHDGYVRSTNTHPGPYGP